MISDLRTHQFLQDSSPCRNLTLLVIRYEESVNKIRFAPTTHESLIKYYILNFPLDESLNPGRLSGGEGVEKRPSES